MATKQKRYPDLGSDTHYQYGISGLVPWMSYRGREPVVASANVDFFISQALSCEICFDQDQTLAVCQRRSTQY